MSEAAEAGSPSEAADKNEGTDGRVPLGGKLLQVLLCVLVVLVWLSLISYHNQDSIYIFSGMSEDVLIRNWIGLFGAYTARGLLLFFGFAAYPVVFLLLLSFLRRLLGGKNMRPAHGWYWAAYLFVLVGTPMLFGIKSDLLPQVAQDLNIAQLPGGVLGQRLCAPEDGVIRMILNPVGSGILAATILGFGLGVLWLYDWQPLLTAWYQKRLQARAAQPKPEPEESTPLETKSFSFTAVLRPAWRTTRNLFGFLYSKLSSLKKEEEKETAVKEEPATKTPVEEADSPPTESPEETADSKPQKETTPKKSAKKTTEQQTQGENVQSQVKTTAKTGTRPQKEYKLPPLSLLNEPSETETRVDSDDIEHKKEVLQRTLESFNIDARVGEATSGPRVTLFEVIPEAGVKVEKIRSITNNIAMELQAVSLRILTPIPGKKSVGVEVPNTNPATVSMRGLMETSAWKSTKTDIPLVLGRDIRGKPVILDLAKAPHLLIAGATGSGKSVCINAMIMSFLFRFKPEDLKLIMVDPKVVEFSCYQSLPHLTVPVITETKKVPLALRWVINEMEKRYRILAKVGARNITAFNERTPGSNEPQFDDEGNEIPRRMPYIVFVIDELADIMMTAKKEVETSLARIAQLSRAVGIHTIVATQRPSVNVITGTIKANFPTRVAFKVTSQVDSRTILDGKGAETLLGRGDMLYNPPGAAAVERNQGPLVEDAEIEKVVGYVSEQREQEFDMSVFNTESSSDEQTQAGEAPGDAAAGEDSELSAEDEELFQRAKEVVARDRKASTSYIQRSLRIGYNRAASLMALLEQRGVVGPQIGTGPREILILPENEENEAEEDNNEESE